MPASNIPHILLLTGIPGIGKTTVIKKLATTMRQYHLGGFYTEEIREAGQRKGFRIVSFNHAQGIIAHVDFDQRYRVGKYGVNVAAIDNFANGALGIREDVSVYLIDEIGKMECLSDVFVSRMQTLLDSDKPVVATVGKKGGGLIEQVKQWPGSQLWEITRSNRDSLVEQITAWLQQQR